MSRANTPSDNRSLVFTLDGKPVEAMDNETLWQVAERCGNPLPHLCFCERPGYRPDGNCRACLVEIEGERVLAPSCLRRPVANMVVHTQSERARAARKGVLELLMSSAQGLAADSPLARLAAEARVTGGHFPKAVGVGDKTPALADNSHPAISVNHQACIQCGLCERACNEVQVNGVIALAMRGSATEVIFDQFDPLGQSSCVACGECVQVCPTGALLPVIPSSEKHAGERVTAVASVCPFCGVGCQLQYQVDDNRIIQVDGLNGPANQGRLCVKGRFGFDYIQHPHRLTKPLIRLSGAVKGLNVDPANPLSHFREASWEEALSVAADGLARLKAEKGGASVAGFGSAKCTNEEAYLFQKLIRQGFGHNNLDHCTRLCHASSVAALMENIGSGAVTATFNEIEHADVAIVIGANPAENHPVAATFFKQFARRGGQLIVMDPRGTTLKPFASHMLQFRPGTDVALLNAIMHVIVDEQLQDQAYIDQHTENWLAMKAHVRAFSPKKMAPICGIVEEDIRAVARTFATARSAMIFWGMGVSQHVHGTDNARCLIALALMCGQVGRSGTGLHPLRGQNNVQGASDAGLIPMFLPDYQSVTSTDARASAEALWQQPEGSLSAEKGLTVVEIMDAIHSNEICGMYILGENPAMSDPDLSHARAALAKLRHLVVQDIFVTETACFADVILPAAAFAEKSGTVTNTNRQVQMARQAVNAPGEARADWQILQQLAVKLGLNWHYDSPRAVFDEMKLLMRSLDNISWDRLEREGAVTYPCEDESLPGASVVFANCFPRPGGRARFTPADLLPPDDIPSDQYPMIMTTGRQLEHWHTGTMTRRSRVLDGVEPHANCSLHPHTLKRLDIAPGDRVRIVSRRGEISLLARADWAVAEDMVFVPFAFVEAAANILTNKALDPVGKIPEFKFSAVRVEAASPGECIEK
ncbi:formate dehydrogenase subunit alpha [Shewanella sp. GXUN23E]|uniref:formate dehydrogenase subunit alpha n=1 Tax=Shewanella sp. GXUN23E TaxID=3422498 RepID=UPI003D7E641C